MKGLLGRKVGMTTVFIENGNAVPVTVVEVTPNLVFGHRTIERDGYTAVQIAHEEFGEKGEKRSIKPQLGEYKKRNQKAHKRIKEFRVDAKELEGFPIGSAVTVELYKKGDRVDVTGVSRATGSAGTSKRPIGPARGRATI